jgi:hypothetical protein
MSGKHNLSATETFKGKPLTVNANGKVRKHNYFLKNSKTEKILKHLQAGNSLSQLEATKSKEFMTIRLSAIIKELRDRGYKIQTTMLLNKKTGSKHGVYHMAGE